MAKSWQEKEENVTNVEKFLSPSFKNLHFISQYQTPWQEILHIKQIIGRSSVRIPPLQQITRGCGLVVSLLAFYYDDMCSNPAEAYRYSFFCKILFTTNENGPFKNLIINKLELTSKMCHVRFWSYLRTWEQCYKTLFAIANSTTILTRLRRIIILMAL